jgi:hypothetical protein
MSLPDFIIIGAARCATTSIYHYLNQHPQIQMSKSLEPNFFVERACLGLQSANPLSSVSDLRSYELEWDNAKQSSHLGEKSPAYLYCESSPRLIRERIPGVGLIAILRNPVERAYSHYLFHRRTGAEELDFWDAVDCARSRHSNGFHWAYDYIGAGMYHSQLSRYFASFPKEQIRILNYDRFGEDVYGVCNEILAFLGVTQPFKPTIRIHNKSGGYDAPFSTFFHAGSPLANVARRIGLRRLLPGRLYAYLDSQRRIGRSITAESCPPDVYQRLRPVYADEIARLSELTGMDFSTWLA